MKQDVKDDHPLDKLYLMFRSRNAEIVLGWTQFFDDGGLWSIDKGDILAERADAIISPANSYGYMDGGIDLAYKKFFGEEIQNTLQSIIRTEYQGKLPVGKSVIIPTSSGKISYLISTPTMDIPRDIRGTRNVYFAFKSALQTALTFNSSQQCENKQDLIRTILIPGMGTGYGKMHPFDSAKQMREAFDDLRKKCELRCSSLDYSLNPN